jgi:hypothetical protein
LELAIDGEQVLVVCASRDIIVEILKWFFGSLSNRLFYPLDVIPTFDSLNNVRRILGASDEVVGSYSLRCVVPPLHQHVNLEIAFHIGKVPYVPRARVTGDELSWYSGKTT